MFSFRNIENKEGCRLGETTILDTLPYFEGHFPERPILPAVAQMRLLEDFLGEVEGRACVIVAATALKFSGIIEPLDVVGISLDIKDDLARFTLKARGNVCSKGSVHFRLKI